MKKILILSSNPIDTPRLRLDKEVREIEDGLQRSKNSNKFVIINKFAPRIKDIRRAILDNQPSIIHFCGHGEKEGIIVENDDGTCYCLEIDALSDFFKLFSDFVECVLLNACYTEKQAEAISENISYVIGMSKGIADKDAIDFAVAFYDTLLPNRSNFV